jgi:DNA-binding IclR family transcriptional regulator
MPGARVIRFLNHLGEVVAAINLSGPEAVMDDPQA